MKNLKALKFWLSSALALIAFQSCLSVDTQLNVVQDGLTLKDASGKAVSIAKGNHPIQLSVSQDSSSPSSLNFTDLNEKFDISLPDADKLVNIVQPLVINSDQLDQPVQMTFEREADSDVDHYALTISSRNGAEVLATARFDYSKSSTPAYDDNSKTFLMSFQDVKYSQRAALIPIDGALPDPMDGIVSHAAQVLLAPWVYARYSTVEWFINSDEMSDEETNKRVQQAVSSSPVIDLFAFNHAGQDSNTLAAAQNLGAKKSQIRLVYTEGCGSANYLSDFLNNYNAAVAIGHRDTSASPFFAFGLVHAWTYGESAHSAMETGYISGSAWIDLIALVTLDQLWDLPLDWSSRGDMIKQSEPAVMWTSEMTPEKLNIDTSAVLKRNTPELDTAFLSYAGSYGKDTQSIPLNSN